MRSSRERMYVQEFARICHTYINGVADYGTTEDDSDPQNQKQDSNDPLYLRLGIHIIHTAFFGSITEEERIGLY